MRLAFAAAVGCVVLALTSSISAAPVSGTLHLRVTAVDPGITALAVGDRFTLAFTIDDSIADTNAGIGAGTFPSLMTAFTATALPGNSGSWTPAGTFDSAGSNFVTNAFGDGFTFQLHGTGFPSGGAGLNFQDFDLGFSVPFDLTDSGLGDTFAQQLGGHPIDFHAFFNGGSVRFTDGENTSVATVVIDSTADNVATLDPRSLALLALLLVVIGIAVLRAGPAAG